MPESFAQMFESFSIKTDLLDLADKLQLPDLASYTRFTLSLDQMPQDVQQTVKQFLGVPG
jgi:hypothetical protein